LLGSRVWISPVALSVCCECGALIGRGLCCGRSLVQRTSSERVCHWLWSAQKGIKKFVLRKELLAIWADHLLLLRQQTVER
jgi:hypothetical protein